MAASPEAALVQGALAWDPVLRARAAAGDTRAVAALARLETLPADLLDRTPAFPCPITDWVQTWPLGHQRGADEPLEAWVLRECRDMGMSLMEATKWLAEVRRG